MKKLLSIILISLMFFGTVFSAGNTKANIGSPGSLQKLLILDDTNMDVNRMNGIFRNNGIWMFDVIANDWGLEWPKGSGLSPVYAGGQYICAKVDGEVRVAGVQHSATEYQPGSIKDDGTASNPLDGAFKWYVIEAGGNGDWANWPTDQGAPVDENGDPKLIGDRTMFSVWNDLADHTEYTTNKLGAEIRQTVFAFNRADALGDMIFIKWQIVNKSGADWDSTFLGLWLDPDVGDGTDDFVGCDTLLGLGFCYNSTNEDQKYGAAPPAMGMDFFQGPIIDSPGDIVTLPDGTAIQDKTMLGMTAFVYYNNDDSNQGNPENGNDVWNYMIGRWRDGSYITNDGANGITQGYPPTKFMFSGDPVTDTGWLDSNANDRRFIMTTGPFDMGPWEDTDADGMAEFGEPGVQEIVAVVIAARGNTNLNSVATLKINDELAQMAYDLDFKLASAPHPPVVSYSELPNQILLSWTDVPEYNSDGSAYESADPIIAQAYGDTVIINNVITEISDSTYNYYGYSVYQYSDASGADPVQIAHWDNGGTADAEPYTSQRYFRILQNKSSVVGKVGDPLVNGKQYYFGVVAEAYCEFGSPDVFESAATIVTVCPQYWSGERYQTVFGDTVEVEHGLIDASRPPSGGDALILVVDPSKVTGDSYKIGFNDDDTWYLINTTKSDTILNNQVNQEDNDAYLVVDGLFVKVLGAAPEIQSIVELDADGNIFDANLWGSLNNYGRSQQWPVIVLHETGSDALDLTRVDRFGTMSPKDYEIIFTADDSSLAFDYSSDQVMVNAATSQPTYLPFTFWRIDLDGSKTRLAVTVLDADGDGAWGRTYYNPFTGTNASFEPLYVYDNAEYKPEDAATYISTNDGTVAPGYGPWGGVYPAVNRFCIGMYYDLNGYADPSQLDTSGVFLGPPAAGEHIKIITTKPNTTNDFYTFTAPDAASLTDSTAKVDLKKVTVVPNPYYGYHKGEMDPFHRWVQFTFLPAKCTIRIFDLAGNLIRKLEKDDDSTSLMQWDLKNEYELPIASGVYVYHVEAPGIGEKVGKMAIFTPNERLDTY